MLEQCKSLIFYWNIQPSGLIIGKVRTKRVYSRKFKRDRLMFTTNKMIENGIKFHTNIKCVSFKNVDFKFLVQCEAAGM